MNNKQFVIPTILLIWIDFFLIYQFFFLTEIKYKYEIRVIKSKSNIIKIEKNAI